MKRILFLLGILLSLNYSLSGQNVNMNKSDLISLLCKRWDVEYAVMGAMKISQKPGAADFDFLFKKDGTYDLIGENGVTNSGSWTYVPEKKYVELSINGKVHSRIKFLDKNKLIMNLVSDGQNDPPGLSEVEVHYKPI